MPDTREDACLADRRVKCHPESEAHTRERRARLGDDLKLDLRLPEIAHIDEGLRELGADIYEEGSHVDHSLVVFGSFIQLVYRLIQVTELSMCHRNSVPDVIRIRRRVAGVELTRLGDSRGSQSSRGSRDRCRYERA